jgi:hypothetical protein
MGPQLRVVQHGGLQGGGVGAAQGEYQRLPLIVGKRGRRLQQRQGSGLTELG